MPLTNDAVNAAVRAEMGRAGVSGRRLERELGLYRGFIQRRLAGQKSFRIDELVRIAEHLGVDPSCFVATDADSPVRRRQPA